MSKEDLATMALLEFLNAVETGIATAKQIIQETKGISEKPALQWDLDRIKWETTQGNKSIYERSEDINNPDFKALLKDLAAHNGKFSRDGYFYWTFRDGSIVGRKDGARCAPDA